MSSDDDEFEKFLQGDSDDEQTALSKTKKKAAKKGSSNEDVQRPTMLLVEVKAPIVSLDDSADPYNFDMNPPAMSDDSDEDEKPRTKKEKKKVKEKEAPKKVSLEDRMAEILKRNGSALAETFAKPMVDEPAPAPVEIIKEAPKEEEDGEMKDEDALSDKSDSYSDSLGMESADFEVGGYSKKTTATKNEASIATGGTKQASDKEVSVLEGIFTLNTSILEQAPPSTDRFRYASTEGSLVDHESDYDDFECTTAEPGLEAAPSRTPVPLAPEASSAPLSATTPTPFKSEFEKMKELFSLPADDEEVDNDAYGDDNFDEENETPQKPTVASTMTAQNAIDMYDDDEFEESGQPPPSPPPPPPPQTEMTISLAPLSPGPPPPPPDSEYPNVPPLDLRRGDKIEKSKQEAIDVKIASILDMEKSATSFLDEPFEFKYDLRAKVETIHEPIEDEPRHSATATEEALPPPAVEAKDASPTSTELDARSETGAKQILQPLQVINAKVPQLLSSTRIENPNRVDDVPRNTSDKEMSTPGIVIQRTNSADFNIDRGGTGGEKAGNPIVTKFNSLQDQLNRSSFTRPEVVDSVSHAYERDKYLIRAFSNKENEMKLQLQAAQREILSLRHQVEALSTEHEVHTLSDARLLGKYVHPLGGVQMTNQAWDDMRKEIETQEALIQGYQVENERLMHQLKEVRRDLQYDVHLNNQELQATIKELRHQLETNPPPVASRHLEAQLRAESRVMALEEELYRVREDRAVKERELKFELDKMKKAKIDLECRVAGVHMDTLHKENEAFESQKAQSEAKFQEYERQIQSLQAKLDWYIQNQRFIDEQEATIKQQQKTISDLKGQLESQPKRTPNKLHRAPADIRRIQALESQLRDMETAMRKRHPDSLVNLILASKPTSDELEANKQSQQEIQTLKDHILEMEQSHELKLTKFRQQHERIVQQLREANRPKSQPETTDVARLRLYYQNKVKDLEQKLDLKGRVGDPGKSQRAEQESRIDQLNQTIEELSKQHKEREANLELQLRASEHARRLLIDASNASSQNVEPGEPHAVEPSPVPKQLPTIVSAPDAKLEQQVSQLQQTLNDLKEAHNKSMLESKELWQEEILHLSEKLSKAHEENQKYAEVAARVPRLEENIQSLTSRLQIPNTPSMLQYQSLEMQIQTLTQKHALREAELKVLLQQATQSSKVEVMQLQQRHERAMAKKNAEIASFQLQLDEMLTEMKQLR
ncbi:Aste57867_20683 [Aphanomyces stellatus]|uniref:Centrosomal protein of 162 kDa n=1 Tax=Aphanomyces stellatus TaxID=120398 RepID=A0A485LFN1_9STRA|nr:hypothetical protein As57867_020615 [Aphanomyces stellatus]VFT97363.1 Aste57867_20683 [Aphanomyces stellatus]